MRRVYKTAEGSTRPQNAQQLQAPPEAPAARHAAERRSWGQAARPADPQRTAVRPPARTRVNDPATLGRLRGLLLIRNLSVPPPPDTGPSTTISRKAESPKPLIVPEPLY